MSDAAPCCPVILVPGIKGTELADEYPTEREAAWSVASSLRGDFKRLALHPDDRRYERLEPARVAPGPLLNLVYEQLLTSLRHELSPAEDQPTPVYAFPYDWRRPLADIQVDLDAFIDEVIARTLLLRPYYRSDYRTRPRVHLVGHSMGGLVIAGYLARHGGERVAKVATLATPFRGSANAVLSIATGQASVTSATATPAEREVARMLPSVYHLLPGYDGALAWPQGLARGFYKPLAWQPSVYQTIAEYIRLYSRREEAAIAALPDRIAEAATILRALLAEAQKHRDDVESLDLAKVGLSTRDWLCIAGIGEPTVDRIVARTVPLSDPAAFAKAAVFDAGKAMEIDLLACEPVDSFDPAAPRRGDVRTGDGTVPLAGAMPTFLPREQLVTVTRHQYAWWEIGDRLISGLVDLHVALPRMNGVQSMIVAHLLGREVRAVKALPLPGVELADWNPPIAGMVPG